MKIWGKTTRFLLTASLLLVAVQMGWSQDEKKAKKAKVREAEVVVSGVGQRTITFQVERKGKVREEVVGIDDQTYIERVAREKITLKDLKEGDKIYLRYEPDAYTSALSVQVVGKGEVKKAGGGD
ncbi:MAG: hypothetical protein HY694_05970 [Deltaproteobacteria bacterium]|nr:hypothetical protein [Deltaproteobacteria bacterium]